MSVQDVVTTKCMLFVILLVIIVIGVVIKRKRGQTKSVYVSIILNYAPSPVINSLIPDLIVEILKYHSRMTFREGGRIVETQVEAKISAYYCRGTEMYSLWEAAAGERALV